MTDANALGAVPVTASQRLRQWWLNRPIHVKGTAVIALPICSLLIAVAGFVWLQQSIASAAGWVQHTQQVRLAAQQLQSLLVDAETGVRGYDITRQKEFLEPYTQSRAALPDALRNLRVLVADNPRQRQQLDEIQVLVDRRISYLETNLTLVISTATDQLSIALLVANLRDGKVVMDDLRQQIMLFVDAEEQLQRDRDAALERQEQTVVTVLIVVALFGSTGALLASVLFSNGITQRLITLNDNALRLACGATLRPLPVSSDEIGQLANAFQTTAATLTAQDAQLHRHTEEQEQLVQERCGKARLARL